jgi:hypothetical protein
MIAVRTAECVVELLREEQAPTPQLVDAAELARIVGRSRDWVYAHANELGARRLPGQRRSRLLFDVQEALAAMRQASPAEPEPRRPQPRRRRKAAASAELLPIGGRRAA